MNSDGSRVGPLTCDALPTVRTHAAGGRAVKATGLSSLRLGSSPVARRTQVDGIANRIGPAEAEPVNGGGLCELWDHGEIRYPAATALIIAAAAASARP